jgi:hypothetical protein
MENRIRGRAKKGMGAFGLLLLISLASSGYAQVVLTEEEIGSLTYIREEEKLARDVYLALYDRWPSRIFKNIAASEQIHMDAIKVLLDRYGIPDPAKGKAPGEFSDLGLQQLYHDLTARGNASLTEALWVGVLIEQTDIDDLTAGIASTARRDIKTVYSNLLQGSLNHLDSFCSNLERWGAECP